jgi:predicted lipid-binding transport protein (Tim44 family)
MTKLMAVVAALVAGAALVSADFADARRLGGGRTLGAQRQATPPPAATTAPAAPSAPMPAAAAKAAPAAAAAPAASGASRWLAPLAGLAAGLGIAALLSHLGLSEAFGSMLMLALLIGGGFLLVRMLMARRSQAAPAPRMQYAGTAPGRVEPHVGQAPARFEPVMGGGAPAAVPAAAAADGKFPAGFDPAPFVAQGKLQFHKLQAAYDAGDRKALSEVMTPEMFAEVSGELTGRATQTPTEVMQLDARVLEAATEGNRHWMSIQFSGLLREDGTVLPKEFDEIWNLTKPVDGSSGWLLAGIQQTREIT